MFKDFELPRTRSKNLIKNANRVVKQKNYYWNDHDSSIKRYENSSVQSARDVDGYLSSSAAALYNYQSKLARF